MIKYKDVVIERLNKPTKNDMIFLKDSIKLLKGDIPITDNFNHDKVLGYANNFRVDKNNVIADLYFDEEPIKRNIANKYISNKAKQNGSLYVEDCELIEVSTVFDSDNKLRE